MIITLNERTHKMNTSAFGVRVFFAACYTKRCGA